MTRPRLAVLLLALCLLALGVRYVAGAGTEDADPGTAARRRAPAPAVRDAIDSGRVAVATRTGCTVELLARASAGSPRLAELEGLAGLEARFALQDQGVLFEARGRFDGRGACRLDGLLPGRYRLVVPRPGVRGEAHAGPRPLRLLRGLEFSAVPGEHIVQAAPVGPARTLRGWVVDDEGPVAGATVDVWTRECGDTWHAGRARTDGQGSFALHGLPPLAVAVRASRFAPPPGHLAELAGAAPLDLGDPWAPLQLRLEEGERWVPGAPPGPGADSTAGAVPVSLTSPGPGVGASTPWLRRPGRLELTFDRPPNVPDGHWAGVRLVLSAEGEPTRRARGGHVSGGSVRVAVGDLRPGTWRLTLEVPDAVEDDLASFMLLTDAVRVFPGRTARRHVRPPAEGWTHVQGWITSGPLSVGEYRFALILDDVRYGPVHIPESGRYRLRVPVFERGSLQLVEWPGTVLGEVELDGDRDAGAPLRIPIPEAGSPSPSGKARSSIR